MYRYEFLTSDSISPALASSLILWGEVPSVFATAPVRYQFSFAVFMSVQSPSEDGQNTEQYFTVLRFFDGLVIVFSRYVHHRLKEKPGRLFSPAHAGEPRMALLVAGFAHSPAILRSSGADAPPELSHFFRFAPKE